MHDTAARSASPCPVQIPALLLVGDQRGAESSISHVPALTFPLHQTFCRFVVLLKDIPANNPNPHCFCRSMSKGVRFSHYFAWGWTDNWEWREGYTTNFGLVDIDFKNKDLPRRPKDSARWMAQHLFRKSNRGAIATEG